jgi:hypothetical protein
VKVIVSFRLLTLVILRHSSSSRPKNPNEHFLDSLPEKMRLRQDCQSSRPLRRLARQARPQEVRLRQDPKPQRPLRWLTRQVSDAGSDKGQVKTRHATGGSVVTAPDRELNVPKYILPGPGDFGNRLYGT